MKKASTAKTMTLVKYKEYWESYSLMKRKHSRPISKNKLKTNKLMYVYSINSFIYHSFYLSIIYTFYVVKRSVRCTGINLKTERGEAKKKTKAKRTRTVGVAQNARRSED